MSNRKRWLWTLLCSLSLILGGALLTEAHAATVTGPTYPLDYNVSETWPPFVRIVPQINGDDAMVYAEGIGGIYPRLGADFGSTSHTWSHTDLDYDATGQRYWGMAAGALSEACPAAEGCLKVYAYTQSGTPGSNTRVPYEFATVGPAATPDLILYLARLRFGALPFTDGVTHTVTLAFPPVAPAPLTGGWQILESGLYVVESDGPDGELRASLSVSYDPDWLDWYDIQPADLRLWRWDASQHAWVMLDSSLSSRLNRGQCPDRCPDRLCAGGTAA